MKHYEWSELDYIAGAAHVEGMSYGRFVSMGMPNLQRFKNRVAAGEFDNKPVRARNRKGTLTAVAEQNGQADTPQKRKAPRPEHFIPEGKCVECGAVIPSEYRSGTAKKRCPACTKKRRAEQKKMAMNAFLERRKAQREEDKAAQSLGLIQC